MVNKRLQLQMQAFLSLSLMVQRMAAIQCSPFGTKKNPGQFFTSTERRSTPLSLTEPIKTPDEARRPKQETAMQGANYIYLLMYVCGKSNGKEASALVRPRLPTPLF